MRISRTSQNAEVYVGSIADVSFLLVIFFMVTSVLTTARGLDLDVGEATKNDEPIEFEEAVDIHILAAGRLVVDRKPMALESLLEYLRPRLEQDPQKPVIVRTDPTAPYFAMMQVLDELRMAPEKAGFEVSNLAIPTLREMNSDWLTSGWSG